MGPAETASTTSSFAWCLSTKTRDVESALMIPPGQEPCLHATPPGLGKPGRRVPRPRPIDGSGRRGRGTKRSITPPECATDTWPKAHRGAARSRRSHPPAAVAALAVAPHRRCDRARPVGASRHLARRGSVGRPAFSCTAPGEVEGAESGALSSYNSWRIQTFGSQYSPTSAVTVSGASPPGNT